MASRIERKLTTILAADAVGYSRAMAADETAALEALRSARAIFQRLVDRHRGRIFSRAGDGLLAEFPSVVEAVQCAVEAQQELAQRKGVAGATPFRIGIHLGDVMVDGDDLFGDGVNLAARLESMADPGGILISQPVYDQVHAKLAIGFDFLGKERPKNLAADVPIYRVAIAGQRRRRSASPAPDALRAEPASGLGGRSGDEPLLARLARHARIAGIVWLGLLAVDILTGPGFWAHWPGIVLLTLLGLEAAPLATNRWFPLSYVRLLALVGALALINLVTWSGTLWVIWLALLIVVIETIRRTRARSS